MQLNIFSVLRERYKITKPIRLIELFAGIGSQAKALKNIGADFETYKVVEFDKFAIASYNAVHNTNFELLDITKITADHLEIVDKDKYEYIMTYSFPCQDLSLTGKGAGMAKGAGTRSGLIWEVERLLNECKELPQVLLMENVPQIINRNHIKDFRKWLEKLESFGYSNYYKNLNAKDFGIPQNRNRTFMVSILGDYYYEFPKPIPLVKKLKDYLEDVVDEKYYLSDKQIEPIVNWKAYNKLLKNAKSENDETIQTITAKSNTSMNSSMILIKEATKQGYSIAEDGDGVYINRPHQKRGVVQRNKIQTLKTNPSDVGVVVKDTKNYIEHENLGSIDNTRRAWKEDKVIGTITTQKYTSKVLLNNPLRIRNLTPLESWRLMGFTDEDFGKVKKIGMSKSQLYKQAGNSIVVNVLESIFKQLL